MERNDASIKETNVPIWTSSFKKVVEWDQSLVTKVWAGYITKIYNKLDFSQLKTAEQCDFEFMDMYLRGQTHDNWWQEVQSKPKLRSYIEFQDNSSLLTLAKAGLPRYTRSVVAKLI